MTADIVALAATARRAAGAGGHAALAHFRSSALATEDKGKAGAFDPVTVADREAEAAIREVLRTERPDDAILGEEEAPRAGTTGLTWVLDPVDGTRAFISGLPTWGVLVGLDDGRRGCVGVVDQPFTGECFTGVIGQGTARATLDRAGVERSIGVRPCPGLAAATLFATAPEMFAGADWHAFQRVRGAVRLARYGIDCYAYALLAMGQIDLVIEAGLAAHDIAAPAALVHAAGGVVTDWRGGDARWGGRVVAAGDRRVHAAALEMLAD